jgi:hypothetical protein
MPRANVRQTVKNPYASLDDAELAMLKAHLGGEDAYIKFAQESEPLTMLRGRQIVERLKREKAARRGRKPKAPPRTRHKWDPERIERLR